MIVVTLLTIADTVQHNLFSELNIMYYERDNE